MDDDLTLSITKPQNSTQQSFQKTEQKYPTETISLPSKGYFYSESHPLSSGELELKLMTAKEEDILTNANLIKKGIVLDKLLESVIVDKRIKPEDFLIGDKNAVFIALRRLAYGDSYGPVSVKCNSCKEDNKEVHINLGELNEKDIDLSNYSKGVNNFEYQLPNSKRNITFKLLTSRDELLIDGEIKSSQKLKLTTNNEFTTRLRYMITSVDGNTDKVYIRKFIENEFLTKDSLAFRKHVKEMSPDIDMTFDFNCEHCNHQEKVGVPLTATFFWPDAQ